MKRKPSKFSIESGEKFGRLTVISYTDRPDKRGEYKCECECGKIVYARTYALKSGKSKSCGCYMRELQANRLTKPNNQGIINEIYRNYEKSAIRRNYEFNLNNEDFKNYITGNCYYCGSKPLKKISPSRQRKVNENNLKINGIDRIDNNIGYNINNCVTCCYICNNSKNTLTLNEWLCWVKKIYKYQNKKE